MVASSTLLFKVAGSAMWVVIADKELTRLQDCWLYAIFLMKRLQCRCISVSLLLCDVLCC